MHKIILSLLILSLLESCGVPQAEHDNLISELKLDIKTLELELDQCENGAEKLIARIEEDLTNDSYSHAKAKIHQLKALYPEAPENKEYQGMLPNINKRLEVERINRAKIASENKRLENLNKTGMWRVGFYVDEFGERTKDGYISNSSLIKGKFSNTATQDSDLNVKFLISNSNNINIQLYEYARNNPVKYASSAFVILVKDSEGKRLRLVGTINGDRVKIGKSYSKQLHNVLMKGGRIEFRISEGSSKYNFNISNAEFYDNAFRKLKEQ